MESHCLNEWVIESFIQPIHSNGWLIFICTDFQEKHAFCLHYVDFGVIPTTAILSWWFDEHWPVNLSLICWFLAVSVRSLHLQRSLSAEPSVLLPLEHHGRHHGLVALPKRHAWDGDGWRTSWGWGWVWTGLRREQRRFFGFVCIKRWQMHGWINMCFWKQNNCKYFNSK